MAKFVLAYKGGQMAATEEESTKATELWMSWFGGLGSAVSDAGNPFGGSTAVQGDGRRADIAAGLTGYSIVTAESLEAAASLAKGCPVLDAGGSVEIYEAVEIPGM
jgi:hypothetical protein